MIIGTSYQIIDPKIGCEMEGYGSRFSTGLHDHLTTSVLFIKNQLGEFLFISLDIIAIPGYRADRIKRQITQKWHIPAVQVIISAIHTHSGPTVTDLLLDHPHLDETYWDKITQATLTAIAQASKQAIEAKIEIKSSDISEGIYGNRNNPHFPYNHNLLRLVAYNCKNKIIASLFLLGSHPTIMNFQNTQLSADLVGEIRKIYQINFGVRPVVMLTDCGDTSTRFTRNESSFDEVRLKAKEIIGSLKTSKTISTSFTQFQPIIVPLISDYDPIINPLANNLWNQINMDVYKATKGKKNMLTGFLTTYRHIRYFGHTHFITCSIIWNCGNFRIVTYPGELVHSLGTLIRHADTKTTLLITLANDYRGYSVDKSQFGKYFESYNSVLLKGTADEFVNRIVKAECQQ